MVLKYNIIYKKIKEDIENGIYKVNSKIEDEKTLAKYFNCSRMTVSKALDLLVQEGYIYRKRGQGTFVLSKVKQKNKLMVPERDIKGLTKITKESNYSISSKVLFFNLEFADKKLAEKLQIKEQDPVYNILRLRIVDNKPYVLERTYMSVQLISGITEEILLNSVYDYIENTLGLKIASANKTLRASISTEEDQKFLNLKPVEPIFEVEQIAYLDDGTPFEYSISRHRYDLFEFTSFALKQ